MMQSVKSFMFGPTPEEQKRKCNTLLRANQRKLDRDMQQLKQVEAKTKSYITAAAKRGQKNPSQTKQANAEVRTFARELVRTRKASARLATSKAQLSSVQMQVNEAFSVRKIEGSLKSSTGIMRDVNSLVKLPELQGTMQELSRELVKAGVIEEMVGDMLPDSELMEGEDEEAEEEVDKVLSEVLKDKMPAERPPETVPARPEEEDEEEETEEMLDQMRGRLEALRS